MIAWPASLPGLAEYRLPECLYVCMMLAQRVVDADAALAFQPLGMLQPAVVAVGIPGLAGHVVADQVSVGCQPQQGDVAQVAGRTPGSSGNGPVPDTAR